MSSSAAWRSWLPKLRRISGRECEAILFAHGFVCVRQKGSHRILQKQMDGRTLTVPVPDHRELALGTLAAIIRQSELSRSLFEAP